MTDGAGLAPAGRRRGGNSAPGGAAARTGAESDRPCSDGAAAEEVAPDDAVLLRAIGEGSEAAFRVLFARWAPPLRRFLIRATRSRETGEDLLQEAFLRVLRAASRYAPDAPPGAWLYRICANLSYSFWRRENRAPRAMSAFGGRDGADPDGSAGGDRLRGVAGRSGPPGWSGPGLEQSPEALRLRGLFTRDLESALVDLPVNQRMAFLLKAGQGLTYEETAEVLGCPEGTAKSRFHHAVLRLRVVLREWEDGIGTEAPPVARREDHPHDL
jgi:RNA polymerase sigma-70 factor, ECF subfamily